jgi:uncharacterized membrane protein
VSARASVTILRPPDEVEQLWSDPRVTRQFFRDADAVVRFVPAPGDRGTEVHVELGNAPRNTLSKAVHKIRGDEPVAKAQDELRRFKQLVETGEIARSEAVPGGEALEAKRRRRPAQPLPADELAEVKR